MDNQQESLENKISIPNLEKYFTDFEGNVYSKCKGGCLKKLTPHLHYGRSNNPYKRIKVNKKLWLVHRLIGSVLINRQLNTNEVVNHKNGITTDNRLENLEVITQRENVQHAIDNNLYCKGIDWHKARVKTKI